MAALPASVTSSVTVDVSLPAGLRLASRPKYLSLALVAIHRAITYRVPTILTFLSNFVWVVILLYLWQTVFAARPQVGTFDWQRMRTYILIAYVVNSLVTHYSESGIIYSIRSGQVVVDLLRPVDYMVSQLAYAAGGALFEAALGGTAALLLGLFVLHISPPASPIAALAFAVSVLIAFLVRFLISFIVSLFSFWTRNGLGLMWARTAVSNVLSGTLIPLQLFPGWLQTVALALPFQALVSTPVLIYLGEIEGSGILVALAGQLAWAVALWVVARLLWRPCVRLLTVHGG
jgi:ABC-2 type transport system permease protein